MCIYDLTVLIMYYNIRYSKDGEQPAIQINGR